MSEWEKNVRRVTPYVPGEQPKIENLIKLNTNENPYPPAPGVQKALQTEPADLLRLYPDPSATVLCEAIADAYGVKKEEVFVGVGSDDVLAMAFLTFFNSDLPILFPDITYSFYDVWADLFRIPFRTCALDENFAIRREDYYAENGGIIFPNPNAPTGVEESQELIRDIIEHNPGSVVIVDEAYVDFGAKSALELIHEYDNVLVVQTFSKSRSLAGMRIGFAFGCKKLIRCLNDVKFSFNSYTMSRLALTCGVASVRDADYFEKTTKQICDTREWVKDELGKLGFTFPDSKSNFLFVTHPKVDAKELFAALRKRGVVVRYFDKPRIDQYLRITIGTREQMQEFLDILLDCI